MWGLKNISSLEETPLDDEDYFRMLLSFDRATLSDGSLFYRGRAYDPANKPAESICDFAPHKTIHREIRVDRSNPYEIYIPCKRGEWAHFILTRGGATELAGMTLDEEDVLLKQSSTLAEVAERQAKIRRLKHKSPSHRQTKRRAPPVKLDREDKAAARVRATENLKRAIGYGVSSTPDALRSPKSAHKAKWAQQMEAERVERLRALRKRKGLL